MLFPRNIIYFGPEGNKNYVYTIHGYKYWMDDVTEDGDVYIEYLNEWLPLFISEADLKLIKMYKIKEELDEMTNFVMIKYKN